MVLLDTFYFRSLDLKSRLHEILQVMRGSVTVEIVCEVFTGRTCCSYLVIFHW
jgi:hypothetical protein